MNCYHFIPGTKLEYLDHVSQHDENPAFNIIVDIEDSVTDIRDPTRARSLKENARENLKDVFGDRSSQKYFVRINNPETAYWDADRRFLQNELPNTAGVVVPKVNGPHQIATVQEYVSVSTETIPIIESKEGVENLETIVQQDRIQQVIFGHHDYFHDIGTFPIPDSVVTSSQYREVMGEIMKSLQGTEVEYIDGIHNRLSGEGLKPVLQYLHEETAGTEIGKLSVHPNHASIILEFEPGNTSVELEDDDTVSEEKTVEHARHVVRTYEDKHSITALGDRYVSPQMYTKAKEVLSNHGLE